MKRTNTDHDTHIELHANAVGDFYDRSLMETMMASNPFIGEPDGYRDERVPRYLTIKVPVVREHTCYDDDDFDAPSGWLVSFKSVQLFKIGTKVESVPYWNKKKQSGKTITFKRYSNLKTND